LCCWWSRSTCTTDLKANQSGISSPAGTQSKRGGQGRHVSCSEFMLTEVAASRLCVCRQAVQPRHLLPQTVTQPMHTRIHSIHPPPRSIWRNLVPLSFLTFRPSFSATSAVR
jgi:hypothetical protein